MDATNLTVPIVEAVTAMCGLLSVTVWVMLTFETKRDSKDKHDAHKERHDELATRVTRTEDTMQQIAKDVSYIRGRLEPKE